mgnify:CR=1 FL=1
MNPTPDIIKKARSICPKCGKELYSLGMGSHLANHSRREMVLNRPKYSENQYQEAKKTVYREGQKDRDREVCNHIVDGSNAVCFPINEDKPTIIFPMGILPNGFNFISKKYLKEHPKFLDEVINKIKGTKISININTM